MTRVKAWWLRKRIEWARRAAIALMELFAAVTFQPPGPTSRLRAPDPVAKRPPEADPRG